MGTIVLTSDETSYESSKSGSNRVIVDDRQVGVLPQRGSFQWNLSTGEHRVRIKRLWLSSSDLHVRISSDEVIKIAVGKSIKSNLRWSLKSVIAPSKSLALSVIDNVDQGNVTSVDTSKLQRGMLGMSVLLVAGLIEFLIGISKNSGLYESVGLSFIVLSFIVSRVLRIAINRKVRSARR